jgi:hypothetical protein
MALRGAGRWRAASGGASTVGRQGRGPSGRWPLAARYAPGAYAEWASTAK